MMCIRKSHNEKFECAPPFFPTHSHSCLISVTGLSNTRNDIEQRSSLFFSKDCTNSNQFYLTRFFMHYRFCTLLNDQSESFPVWKASFANMSIDLCVNAREELDLQVKQHGPETSKYAQSIRIPSASDPAFKKKRWDVQMEGMGAQN